jgi:hypothetical protein
MGRDSEFASTLANYTGQAGYAAGLDSSGLVPTAQLATGATSTSVFYRGDRTFASTGAFTSGTPCTQNPISASTVTGQAHGLASTPTWVFTYAECIATELGYAVGQRVRASFDSNGANDGWNVTWDAQFVSITTPNGSASGILQLVNLAAPGAYVAATLAKWKIVAVPYL